MSPENKFSSNFSRTFLHILTKNKEFLTPSSNGNQIPLEHLSFTLIIIKKKAKLKLVRKWMHSRYCSSLMTSSMAVLVTVSITLSTWYGREKKGGKNFPFPQDALFFFHAKYPSLYYLFAETNDAIERFCSSKNPSMCYKYHYKRAISI